MPSERFFTREEVLGGLPAKRASMLLFLVESRTGQLTAQAHHAMDLLPTPTAVRERDLAFIEAFALGRQPPRRPTARDLERFAPEWAHLVPDNPRIRASLARLLGQKYRLPSGA